MFSLIVYPSSESLQMSFHPGVTRYKKVRRDHGGEGRSGFREKGVGQKWYEEGNGEKVGWGENFNSMRGKGRKGDNTTDV